MNFSAPTSPFCEPYKLNLALPLSRTYLPLVPGMDDDALHMKKKEIRTNSKSWRRCTSSTGGSC